MLEDDQVCLCLAGRKSPIEGAEIHTDAGQVGPDGAAAPERKDGILIEAEDDETLEFVQETYKRFWQQGLPHALSMEEYGRSACEAIYRVEEETQQIVFHALKWIHPRDAKPFVYQGRLAWIEVKSIHPERGASETEEAKSGTSGAVKLMGVNVEQDSTGAVFATTDPQPAKGVWFVRHGHGGSNWYGRSVMNSSWYGWRLKTMPDGTTETIFKYAYRHALGPFIGRHPDVMVDGPGGAPVFAGDLMRVMLAEIKNGANIIMNNSRDDSKEFQWQIDLSSPPGGQGAAEGLLAISDWEDRKIQRGMAIPDEVISHDGQSGGGYSRAQVSALAFYVGCERTCNNVISQFDDQVAKPLVALNKKLGKLGQGSGKYKVTVKSLFPESEQSSPATPGQQPQEQQTEAPPSQSPQGPEAIPFSLRGEITPTHWANIVTHEAPHALVVGESGSGKSTIAQALVNEMTGDVAIIDPLWTPKSWGGAKAITVDLEGSFAPIAQAIDDFAAEMKRRRAQLQAGEIDFERLNIVWDEIPLTISEVPKAGEFIRHISNFGRHVNMHLIGMSQSDRVGSLGLENFGDARENFVTIYLGRKAIEQMPELAGQEHAGVLDWHGKRYPIDLTEIMEKASRPIDRKREFKHHEHPRHGATGQFVEREMSRAIPPHVPFYIQLRERLARVMNETSEEYAQRLEVEGHVAMSDGWRQMGAKTGADGKKHGGTPVQIKGGEVVKGPAALKGKDFDASHGFVKEKAESPSGAEQPKAQPASGTRTLKTTGDYNPEVAKKVFGHEPTAESLSVMMGLPDSSAEITLRMDRFGIAYATVKGDGYDLVRSFYHERGKFVCKNEEIEVHKQGTGLGSRIFCQQVQNLAKEGKVKKIECLAAGGGDNKWVGYKVWPKMGYDGELQPEHFSRLFDHTEDGSQLEKALKSRRGGGEIKTIQQLYAVPGGMELWEKHGFNIDLSFDLSPESQSMQTLNRYMEKKNAGRT